MFVRTAELPVAWRHRPEHDQDLNWGVKDRKATAPRQDPTESATADDVLREEIKTNCQRVSRGLSPRPLEWDKSELTGRRSVP